MTYVVYTKTADVTVKNVMYHFINTHGFLELYNSKSRSYEHMIACFRKWMYFNIQKDEIITRS